MWLESGGTLRSAAKTGQYARCELWADQLLSECLFKCRKSYWDQRFETGWQSSLGNEWYADYNRLKDQLLKHLDRSASVHITGCGLSLMAEDMARDQWEVYIKYVPHSTRLMRVAVSWYTNCGDLTL